jgi:signal transduction histidine kinase
MKSSRSRRSPKASPDDATKPARDSRATRHRRGVVRGAALRAANAPAEPQRALAAPGASVRGHEHTLPVREAALRAREASAHTRADVERVMGQMREANERLIVSAVQAQNLSDAARLEAARARSELEDLMSQLRAANEQLAAMAEEASEREKQYRRLSGRLLTLQDEERRRLALDLHDSTGQCLAALTMNLDVVGRATEALDARSRRALAESRSLASQCAREVRTFAYLLHPPLLDELGLLSAVRWYAEGFARRSGIHVTMDLGEIGRLPGPIETALFRVVQEGLTNVHRHASTTTASIRLTATADAVALEIHDQGHGHHDPVTHEHGTLRETLGVGIQGMRERMRQLGGTFDVAFTDTGTTVRVRVPVGGDIP